MTGAVLCRQKSRSAERLSQQGGACHRSSHTGRASLTLSPTERTPCRGWTSSVNGEPRGVTECILARSRSECKVSCMLVLNVHQQWVALPSASAWSHSWQGHTQAAAYKELLCFKARSQMAIRLPDLFGMLGCQGPLPFANYASDCPTCYEC